MGPAFGMGTSGRCSFLGGDSLEEHVHISNGLGIATIVASYQIVVDNFYLEFQRVGLLVEIILKDNNLLLG